MNLPKNLRAFDDYDTARENIFSGVVDALQNRFPIEDDNHVLKLTNVQR